MDRVKGGRFDKDIYNHRRLVLLKRFGARGQSTLEYAIFVGVVAAALVSMSTYVRRAIQANFKMLEERINVDVAVR